MLVAQPRSRILAAAVAGSPLLLAALVAAAPSAVAGSELAQARPGPAQFQAPAQPKAAAGARAADATDDELARIRSALAQIPALRSLKLVNLHAGQDGYSASLGAKGLAVVIFPAAGGGQGPVSSEPRGALRAGSNPPAATERAEAPHRGAPAALPSGREALQERARRAIEARRQHPDDFAPAAKGKVEAEIKRGSEAGHAGSLHAPELRPSTAGVAKLGLGAVEPSRPSHLSAATLGREELRERARRAIDARRQQAAGLHPSTANPSTARPADIPARRPVDAAPVPRPPQPAPPLRDGVKGPVAPAGTGQSRASQPSDSGAAWNLAFASGSFPIAQVGRGRLGVLEDMQLKSASIVVAGTDNNVRVASLPRALQPAVRDFASKEGVLALKKGVNFFGEIQSFSGMLRTFEQAFGIKPGPIRIDGSVGGDFVRHFADGNAASTSQDIDDIRIRVDLPGIAPPPLAGIVESGPTALQFHAASAKIEGSGRTTIQLQLEGRRVAVETSLAFTDKPAIGADFVSVTGRVPKPSDLLPAMPNLEVSRLEVDFGIVRLAEDKTEERFDLAGDAAFKKKPVSLKGRFIREDAKKPFVELAVASATLSVADFVPGSVGLPGLDAVKVTEARLRNDFVSMTARFRSEDTTAYMFASPGRKAPSILIVHDVFRFSDYVPLLKGTPIDGLGQIDNAMFLYVPGEGVTGAGGSHSISLDDLPKPVWPKFSGGSGDGRAKIELKPGLNFFGHLDLKRPGGAKELLQKLGLDSLGQARLPLSGAVDPAVLRPAVDQVKQIAVQIIESIDITAPLPAFKPRSFPAGMEFKSAAFSLKGEKEPSKPDHPRVDVGVHGDVVMTVRGLPLELVGGVEVDKEIGGAAKALKFAASAKRDWDHPLGLQWLSLKEIDISADLEESSQQSKSLDFKIGAKASINGKPVIRAEGELIIANGKVEDIIFRLPDRVDVSALPHIGKVPGVDQFSFANLAISTRELAGDLTWKPKNITQKAAVYFGGADRSQVTLFYSLENFSLGKLVPHLASSEVGRVELPKLVLTVSTHEIAQTDIGQVPEEVRRIMSVVSSDPSYRMEVAQGVGMLAPLDPKSLGGELKAALTRLNITDPVVLGGGIGGILGGVPRLNLKARLPRMPLPKNLPRFLNLAKDAGGAFYLAYGGSVLDAGLEVDAEMVLGLANRQPKLVTLQLGVELGGSGGVGVRTLGSVKGKWPDAMGMIGLDLEEATFKLGVDADSAVEVGMRAHEIVEGNRIDYDILVAIIPEVLTPTKLAVAFDAQEFGLSTYLAMGEVYLKTALAQPFFAQLLEATLRRLGDKKAAGSVEWYEQKIRNAPSIDKLLPVDQLPVFHFKNVKAKLVMPGSGDPQLDLDPGVGLAGQLWFGGKDLGRIDSSLTFTGLKASGELDIRQIGPLSIDKAKVDIDASIGLDPHFKIFADARLFGAREDLEIIVDKSALRFHKVNDLGPMGRLTWDARTDGIDLAHLKDFVIDGSFSSKFGPWLAAEVSAELRPGASGLAHIASDVETAKRALDGINALAAARRQALSAAQHALDAVNEKVARLPGGQAALELEQWLINELNTAKARVGEAERALIKDAEIAAYRAAYDAALKAQSGIVQTLGSLVVNAATVHGSLQDAMAGKPVKLHLDASVANHRILVDVAMPLDRPRELRVGDLVHAIYQVIKSDLFGKRT